MIYIGLLKQRISHQVMYQVGSLPIKYIWFENGGDRV